VMEQVASDTGGEAVYTTNDISTALARDIQNGAHYFTLAYTPSNEKMDGKYRRIEVKLPQGKYRLSYGRGYYADSATPPASPSADPLVQLMARGMPSATQILYRVLLAPAPIQPAAGAARAGGNTGLSGHLTRCRLDFVISATDLNIVANPNGARGASIEIAIVAYDRSGKAVNWTGGKMNMSLNPASYAKAQRTGISAPMEIDLPDTGASLATGIYDLNSGKAGSLDIPLSVDTIGQVTLPTSQP
jgi:hypothetical protein